MLIFFLVIPSKVERPRGVTFQVTLRDSSTPLRFAQNDDVNCLNLNRNIHARRQI